MDKYSDKQFQRGVRWRKVVLTIVMSFAGILALELLLEQDYYDGLILGLITALLGYSLKRLMNQSYQVKAYEPHQGFKFYRQSSQNRLRQYTIIQSLFAIPIIFNLIHFDLTNIIKALLPVIYIQTNLKGRIRLHVTIDDVTYFELEELKIINDGVIVRALYKDFADWTDLKKGSKILLVTQDRFICVSFRNRNEADQYSCLLSQVNRLGIVRAGIYGGSYLFTIGRDNQLIQVKLLGQSHMDSPEEFMAFLLKELDQRKLGIRNTEKRECKLENLPDGRRKDLRRIAIRELDFIDFKNDNILQNNDMGKAIVRVIDL